ncbi:hypothetical protein EB796_017319 [Bugula neritina]|uniref:Peptidase S54 rhomboid domain-containing protein n=1 Tax=Bugula neritina TaxID=10212 RepID=A0A7J7JEE6_BUGNE|nr:hypothetical protein EB796_017319 [Bugula neritina]
MMQRVRAHSFQTQSQEAREVKDIVGNLSKATSDEDELPKFSALSMTTEMIKTVNQAFMQDLELYGKKRNSEMPELFSPMDLRASAINQKRSFGGTPFVDENTLKLHQQPSALAAPQQNIFSSNLSLANYSNYQFDMNSDLALQDSAVTPTKSPISVASVNNRQGNRRETLYDNFYTDDHTSPAKLNVNRFKSSSAISTTWGGKKDITYKEPTNLLIGPSESALIQLGAIFAPCIRQDKLLSLRVAQHKAELKEGLGCCEVYGSGAGTTTKKECSKITEENLAPAHDWINLTCNARLVKTLGRSFEAHIFKPCCYGNLGQCELTTSQHCKHIAGVWHSDVRESCSQVHCSTDVCRAVYLWSRVKTESSHLSNQKNVTDDVEIHSHNQFWRVLVSLFYHHGFLHILFVGAVQCIMGLEVEKVTGWLRIAAIYTVSGYGGLLIGSIARPYQVNIGAQGAVFGLIGMNLVELIQAWKLVDKPWKAVLKLGLIITLGVAAGLLPQV